MRTFAVIVAGQESFTSDLRVVSAFGLVFGVVFVDRYCRVYNDYPEPSPGCSFGHESRS